MYKVEVSHRYVYDMNACINYISHVLCNCDAAIKLKNKADTTIDEIAKNPYIYSSYISNMKLKNEYRKAKVNNYYINDLKASKNKLNSFDEGLFYA